MDWVPLPAPINPLAAVRRTTAGVCARAAHVSLNDSAIEQVATMWATDGGAGGPSIGWNETGWHYSEDAATGGNLTCTYVFVLGESFPELLERARNRKTVCASHADLFALSRPISGSEMVNVSVSSSSVPGQQNLLSVIPYSVCRHTLLGVRARMLGSALSPALYC